MRWSERLAAVSGHIRRRRMQRSARAFQLTSETQVLDIGGTPECWELIPVRPRLVLLNTPRARDDLAGGRVLGGRRRAVPALPRR